MTDDRAVRLALDAAKWRIRAEKAEELLHKFVYGSFEVDPFTEEVREYLASIDA